MTPSTSAGGGMLYVFGSDRVNRFAIYESGLRKLSPTTTRYAWLAGAEPAYKLFEDEIPQLIEVAGKNPGWWSWELAARLTGLTAAVSVLLRARSTDELQQSQWVVIEDLSDDPQVSIVGLPPCISVRWADGAKRKAVKCPTLRKNFSDLPPDLYVNAEGGEDTVELALQDLPPYVLQRYVDGGDDRDVLIGSNLGDVLAGGEGADTIAGRNGDDEIWGHDMREWNLAEDRDEDTLFGDDGSDVIMGQHGSDLVDGGPGDDNRNPQALLASWLPGLGASLGSPAALQGGVGKDVVIGGTGRDTMAGNEEQDTLLASETDFGGPVEERDPIVNCQGSLMQPPDSGTEYYRRSNTPTARDDVLNCNKEIPRPVRQRDVNRWLRNLLGKFPWTNW